MIIKSFRRLTLAFVAVAVLTAWIASSAMANTRQIPAAGVTSPHGGVFGAPNGGIQNPEFPGAADGDQGPAPYSGSIVDRSNSTKTGKGASASSGKKAKSNPELNTSFDGLNFFQQRFANGGNQFSVEPPDQGLCVGNGFVVETVNDVFNVYNTAGVSQLPANGVGGAVDLNTFFGYSAAIKRSPPNPAPTTQGPFVTDPSCYYDQPTGRWFLVVLTLEVKPTAPSRGAFLGPNHLDLAVSQTSNPTGNWTIYRVPVQDDGTAGTPDHHCSPAAKPPPAFRTNPRACIGDYPHIGADANGFYITTNEYDFFTNAFHGAQVYAFSKAVLASGVSSVGMTQIDTATMGAGGKPGFTIWPTNSPANQYATDNGGSEYFLSSDAADEAQCDTEVVCSGTGTSDHLLVWSLTNTSSLNTSSPSVSLSNKVLTVGQYGIPPKANQKETDPSDFPQGQCFNIPECSTAILLGIPDPFAPEVVSHLDSNDTRMQQTWYSNGKVWGALDTALAINGQNKAGIEYFIVNPSASKLVLSGYLGLPNNNLTYPAVAATQSGRGVMAFTVVGDDYHPSAGYASLDAKVGAGDVHIAQLGAGIDDGFTSYKAQVGDPPRTRWGDYGSAAVDGQSIWIASEYIGQSCTLSEWLNAPLGRCGGTRGALGNWDTRISKLNP